MEISHITLLVFVVFSSLRIISYFPQIYRVATDDNGASAIAYSTWSLWVGANVSTALYASVNLQDAYLASVSILYAVCCVLVIVLTIAKRRLFRSRVHKTRRTVPNRKQRSTHSAWRWPGAPTRLQGASQLRSTARWR